MEKETIVWKALFESTSLPPDVQKTILDAKWETFIQSHLDESDKILVAHNLHPDTLTDSIKALIDQTETYLQNHHNTKYQIIGTFAENMPTGAYITDEALKQLFTNHPPITLRKALAATIETHSPREIASLCRHTESRDWLKTYLKLLAQLPNSAFAAQKLRIHQINTVDTKLINTAITQNGRNPKPWHMSHSKEAGVITRFENTTSFTHPELIDWILHLHYVHEASAPGQALAQENIPHKGAHIAAIIKSGKQKLYESNANIFSEDMYWRQTWQSFTKLHSVGQIQILSDLYHGVFIIDQNVQVGNPIDHIWNMNFTDRAYFPADSTDSTNTFIYHAREALLNQMLRNKNQRSEQAHDAWLIQHLHISDPTIHDLLTKK